MKAGQIDEEKSEILMLIAAVVQPKFTREHYGQLRQKNSGVIDRILFKITAISGMDKESMEKATAQFQG